MTEKKSDLIAIVFDMKEGQLRAALYQIAMGDDLKTALDKARGSPQYIKKHKQEEFFK